MSNQGTIEVDFGAFPGKGTATVTVTGQTALAANSLVEAWVFPSNTGSTDHSVDEHLVDYFNVVACNVVAATSFDILAIAPTDTGNRYGKYRLGWAWGP